MVYLNGLILHQGKTVQIFFIFCCCRLYISLFLHESFPNLSYKFAANGEQDYCDFKVIERFIYLPEIFSINLPLTQIMVFVMLSKPNG